MSDEAPRDLEDRATAAYLTGDDAASADAWAAAYERHLGDGRRSDAARCAFWLALTSMLRNQPAHAGGWLSRAEAAVDHDPTCEGAGYLLVAATVGALESGETTGAGHLAQQALEVAAAHADPDLNALATLGTGQALIAAGETSAGIARLDAAMLTVERGDVGPIASGIVYCAVILECMQLYDLARAAEWTDALDQWCRARPEMVPFRGQCLIHQSQLRQAAGDWAQARTSAALACERLSDPPHPALGLAFYQRAELHRVRGAHDEALHDYERAGRAGHEPEPGLALVHLAAGDTGTAVASIRRALHENLPRHRRAPLLSAAVDVFRAAGDRDQARSAARELRELAAEVATDAFDAMAADATGAVLIDEGDMTAALAELRTANSTWRRLEMPHHAARTGVLIGLACAALGDSGAAAREFAAARATFESLEARTDLVRLRGLTEGLQLLPSGDPGRALTPREREVLAHVAEGKTSPEIGEALTISRHTVRRHLENIYAKLGVNSRAAATAAAYEHDLL